MQQTSEKGKYLVVIDYQNDFVNGSLGFEGADKLDAVITSLLEKYQKNSLYTLDTHFENYLETQEGRKLPVKHCIKGSEGWQVYGQTGQKIQHLGAIEIQKSIFGVETQVWRDALLKNFDDAQPLEFTLVGLVTDICVLSNAVSLRAAYPEAQIRVVTDGVNSYDAKNHEMGLAIMQNSLQVELITSADIL